MILLKRRGVPEKLAGPQVHSYPHCACNFQVHDGGDITKNVLCVSVFSTPLVCGSATESRLALLGQSQAAIKYRSPG